MTIADIDRAADQLAEKWKKAAYISFDAQVAHMPAGQRAQLQANREKGAQDYVNFVRTLYFTGAKEMLRMVAAEFYRLENYPAGNAGQRLDSEVQSIIAELERRTA